MFVCVCVCVCVCDYSTPLHYPTPLSAGPLDVKSVGNQPWYICACPRWHAVGCGGTSMTVRHFLYTIFAPIQVRGMDGLVVCAMAGARRGRGFEPRFVRPSRGPPVRPPPPPPSASRSTTGTAGATGGVSPPFFPTPTPAPGPRADI